MDFQNGIIIVLEHIEQIEVQIATKKNQRGAAATFNMLFAWASAPVGWQALPYLPTCKVATGQSVFWKMEKQTCPPGSSFLLSTLGVNSFATDRYCANHVIRQVEQNILVRLVFQGGQLLGTPFLTVIILCIGIS